MSKFEMNDSEAVVERPPTEDETSPLCPAATRVLRVQHETRYHYDAPVELAHHTGLLRPRDTPRQRVREWRLSVTPRPEIGQDDVQSDDAGELSAITPGVQQVQDVWGNWRVCFSHSHVHERLVVLSTFVAEIAATPSLNLRDSPPWEKVAERLRYRPGVALDDALEFSLPSAYAPREASLAKFAREVFRPGVSVLGASLGLMHLIYRRFAYRPSVTSVATRAPEALAQRQGVCQDFAHVMIGGMRSLGLAARYVSGYLLTQPPPGQPRLVGADASHAWVEIWCPRNGWVALDPTNAVLVGPDHVTLAWGRDYADVAPLRGVIRGGGRAVPRVAVTVEPVEPDDDQANPP